MNTEFVLAFVVLFGATIALICAVYVSLIHRKIKRENKLRQVEEIKLKEIEE